MATFTREEAAGVLGGRWLGIAEGPGTPGPLGTPLTGYAIDSRKVREGDLFFAIQGPNHDGHDFLDQAFARGASAAVVTRSGLERRPGDPGGKSRAYLEVPDTLKALQDLASRARRRRPLLVAGITGSSGKTTTKELAAVAVGARLRVHRTPGNLNNAYGLPLALLEMPDDTQAAVLEMGMSTPGEIARLAEISDPDVGAILNVGEAHRMNFASVDAIADAKGELFAGMRSDAVAVYNAADGRVAARAAKFAGRRLSFGVDCAADIAVRDVVDDMVEGVSFRLRTANGSQDGLPVSLRLYGRHNAANAAAAFAIALACGVEPEAAAPAVAAFPAVSGRGEVARLGAGVVLVDETYNSNPTAMRAVLASLAATRWNGRKVVVCGDMLELGDEAPAEHRGIGRSIAQSGADALVAIGLLASETVAGFRSAHPLGAALPASAAIAFADSAAAAADAGSFARAGDLILVKGSRGIATEAVARAVRTLFPAGRA